MSNSSTTEVHDYPMSSETWDWDLEVDTDIVLGELSEVKCDFDRRSDIVNVNS